ncbi:alginate lyase family protein [Allorhizobium terrae]|uniref:Poly(Beta-D-mannuronate) lyase n=1 Tax=Allorhizobium terrae TaxID=1848972 RepID=A0A4S3ZW84_9HYPH|nr:alginate lyase family protein [Allorhizobium terrae]THF50110.1 poly(beta-D-mannuronate) lyase [Allorhizobium terrae]
MKSVFPALWGISLLLSCQASAAEQAKALASPWDGSIAQTTVSNRPCAALPALSQGVTASGYYTDKNHSIIDQERLHRYKAATQSIYDTATIITRLADRYQQEGDLGAAACAAADLATLAKANSLTGTMQGNQASYVQGWVLGAFSIAWLKIRSDSQIEPRNRSTITHWLATMAMQNRRYYDQRPKAEDARNNHRYWAGLAMSAAGIAANRRDLFDWGVDSARIGLRQVTPDGSLPLEMGRRAKALHYHLFAVTPLVITAELAKANGIDLYQDNDGALKRLARFALNGITDPSPFVKAAGVAQEPITLAGGTVGWLIPYQHRFPAPEQQAMLDKMSSKTMLYFGGLPPR